MFALVTGLGGPYCLYVMFNRVFFVVGLIRVDGFLLVQIADMFNINRTMNETKQDYNRLLKKMVQWMLLHLMITGKVAEVPNFLINQNQEIWLFKS